MELEEGKVYRLKSGKAITSFGSWISEASPVVLVDGKLICNWVEIFVSYDAIFEEDKKFAPLYHDLASY